MTIYRVKQYYPDGRNRTWIFTDRSAANEWYCDLVNDLMPDPETHSVTLASGDDCSQRYGIHFRERIKETKCEAAR